MTEQDGLLKLQRVLHSALQLAAVNRISFQTKFIKQALLQICFYALSMLLDAPS